MKSLLVALCSLAMASAIVVEICDPEITEAHFDNLDIAVDPDPIVVETGKQVGLHFAIDLLTQINGGTVKIDIVSGILPVPCLEVFKSFYLGCSFGGSSLWVVTHQSQQRIHYSFLFQVEGHKVGSCEYTTEELVGAFCQLCEAIGNCEELLPPGQACALPAAPGHYGGVNGGDDMVYVDIPEIPDIILQFLNGTLKIHILGKDENGNEDLCADVTLDVVVP